MRLGYVRVLEGLHDLQLIVLGDAVDLCKAVAEVGEGLLTECIYFFLYAQCAEHVSIIHSTIFSFLYSKF